METYNSKVLLSSWYENRLEEAEKRAKLEAAESSMGAYLAKKEAVLRDTQLQRSSEENPSHGDVLLVANHFNRARVLVCNPLDSASSVASVSEDTAKAARACFVLERKEGAGPVRYGDIVMFRPLPELAAVFPALADAVLYKDGEDIVLGKPDTRSASFFRVVYPDPVLSLDHEDTPVAWSAPFTLHHVMSGRLVRCSDTQRYNDLGAVQWCLDLRTKDSLDQFKRPTARCYMTLEYK
ncbi:hypothetical protein KIPB_000405 [Kipferlia bialata]|uniref:Uncharacterized protein n=1 Tax=Kipferlia bialata TaxID=797122 RepID=A0A9K3GEY2_9EUKA|nr:hypothetical protein KIPB_000405 [Kipferlia bialata]|eukprot:g405.t1